MKKYLGVKIIQAEPMFEAKFINQVKNEDVPASCQNREGYKVVYEDGYTSWSPKEVFEKAYKEIPEDASKFESIQVDTTSGEWERMGFFRNDPEPGKSELFDKKRTSVELSIKSLMGQHTTNQDLIERAKEIYKFLTE